MSIRKLFSRHSRAALHRKSQRFWQHAPDLCNLKTSTEGGAGVSPTSSCTDSSSGSQPGSKARVLGQASHLASLLLGELLCLFGTEKCLLVWSKTYRTLPQQTNLQFQSMRLSAWKSLGPPCRECHLAADVNTLLLSSGSPHGDSS